MAHDKTPLLGREWFIEDIAGAGVIDNSHATLLFLADGRLAGSTGCNRLIGSYRSSETALSLQTPGATRMACAPALMHQEQRLLELLPAITQWQIDTKGILVLRTASGQTLTARRR